MFCILRSILATFDPNIGILVGSFCGDFLGEGFFDSLGRRTEEKVWIYVDEYRKFSKKDKRNKLIRR